MVARYWPSNGFASWPANPACSITLTDQYTVNQSVTLGEGLSFEQSSSGSAQFGYQIGDNVTFTLDPTATYTFYADVEEWFEVIDPMVESDANGFPTYGGVAAFDGVTARSVRFYERLRPLGEMGVTLGGLVPRSMTRVISQADSDEFGDVVYGLDRRGQVFVENSTGLMVISGTVAGLEPNSDYVKTTANSSFDARPGFVLSLSKGVLESGSSYGYSLAWPKLDFEWRGDFFAGSDVLLEPYQVVFERLAGQTDFVTVTGSGISSWSHRVWQGFATLDGVNQASEGLDNRRAIRHWLLGSSLSARGDNPTDWRMQFRGRSWLAMSASLPESRVLDAGGSLQGWSAIGASLSGGVMITVGPGGGSASRVFDPAVTAESWRTLEFEVRSIGAGSLPLSLGVGSKQWEFATGLDGEWVTLRADLCRPDSESVVWDEKESRYPLDEFDRVVDSPHWGVSRIEGVILGGLAANATYEVRTIQLRRFQVPTLSFLPSFGGWRAEQTGANPLVKPLVWGETDGRVWDAFGLSQVGTVPSWASLSDLAAVIVERGWTVNPGVAAGDGYHSNLREADLAWGGGVRPLGNVGVDRPGAPDPLEVWAHGLWDEVQTYPSSGDIWQLEGSAFGSLVKLHSGKVLRAQAWGLTLGNSGARSGLEVFLRRGVENRGSDFSDSRGIYLTGLPGGQAGLTHRVEVGSAASPEFTPVGRMRHRRVHREQSSAGALSFDWHPAGMAVRGTVGSDSQVRIARKANGVGATYEVITTPFVAASLCVRWDRGRLLRLILVTEEQGQIKERWSDDLGETWSMANTLATGNVRYPSFFVHEDGRRFVYWIEDGAVNGVIRDGSGAVIRQVTAARSGVEPKGLAVDVLNQAGGAVRIEMVTIESDSVVSSLSSDGITFS
jgi:hypothetical protein